MQSANAEATDERLALYGGGWAAHLAVELDFDGQRSFPAKLEHSGPLRIQKVLYPEGPALAHLILLHPPAGIAGGDTLSLDFRLRPRARMLLTTPGAGRWYRADAMAHQHIRLQVAEGASLEWLPQECVLHDGARGEQRMDVEIDAGASAIGLEVMVLGRHASGESLHELHFHSALNLRRHGRLLLAEQLRIFDATQGLAAMAGAHVSGLLWAVSPTPLSPEIAETLEAHLDRHLNQHPLRDSQRPTLAQTPLAGVSLADPHLLLVRVLGCSPEKVRLTLIEAWRQLRPGLIGQAARTPRIWMT